MDTIEIPQLVSYALFGISALYTLIVHYKTNKNKQSDKFTNNIKFKSIDSNVEQVKHLLAKFVKENNIEELAHIEQIQVVDVQKIEKEVENEKQLLNFFKPKISEQTQAVDRISQRLHISNVQKFPIVKSLYLETETEKPFNQKSRPYSSEKNKRTSQAQQSIYEIV